MNLKCCEITDSRSLLFDKMWEVYQYSFPEYEQRSKQEQIDSLEKDGAKIDCYFIDDEFIGFIIYWELDGMTYIEHYAMAKEMRSKGYGSHILKDFIDKRSPKLIVLDIDPTVDDISIRREQFYIRLGFKRNEIKHIYPSYDKDKYEPFELILMSCNRVLTDQEYAYFKKVLYDKIINGK